MLSRGACREIDKTRSRFVRREKTNMESCVLQAGTTNVIIVTDMRFEIAVSEGCHLCINIHNKSV